MTKYKQFKDLTREEKLGIFEAALDGELEKWCLGEWRDLVSPNGGFISSPTEYSAVNPINLIFLGNILMTTTSGQLWIVVV